MVYTIVVTGYAIEISDGKGNTGFYPLESKSLPLDQLIDEFKASLQRFAIQLGES